MNNSEEVIIWGTGSAWESFHASYPDIRVKRFVDNNPLKQGKYLDGIEILAPAELVEYDAPVIVASEFFPEILPQLKEILKEKSNSVYTYEDFLIEDVQNLIVSFPKCGRTWLRTILGRILQKQFNLPESSILYLTDAPLPLQKENIPILLAYHDQHPQHRKFTEIEFDAEKYAGKNVLFMMRRPHDVMVSLYYHLKYRAKQECADRTSFISEKIKTYIRYCNVWYENRKVFNKFEIVTYEQMHTDCFSVVQKAIEVLFPEDLKIDESIILEAIQYSDFKKMKKLETSDKISHHTLNSTGDDERAMKTRKGKIGGYKEELSEAEIANIDQVVQRDLNPELFELLYNE